MRETLDDLLKRAGGTAGTDTLLFDRGASLGADRFRDDVARIAGGFSALGIGRGDRVAIWLPNVPAWLAMLFALARLGAIAVSVNTRFRSLELSTILRRAAPRALVYWPGFNGIDFAGILAQCDRAALTSVSFCIEYAEAETPVTVGAVRAVRAVEAVRAVDEVGAVKAVAAPRGMARIAWDELATLPDTGSIAHAATSVSPCILFSTSGTTKEPKLVMHDQATLVGHATNVAARWRLSCNTALYLVPPFCGVYGFCSAMAALAGGAPIWMRPVWDADAAAGEIVRGGCTHITGTDDAYAQLLAAGTGPRPYPSVVYAGFAPFNPALSDIVAIAETRGLTLSGLYGASEVQALFSTRASDSPAGERAMAGGYPVDPEARVRARDPDTGVVLADGCAGELEILAPGSRMVGYFGDVAATTAAFTDDGWYRTGDLGWTTADGGFVYVSRTGDSMRLGGFLVSPVEIEGVVLDAGGVKACQVVAVPRPEGVLAVAFVIPADGCQVDEARLTGHLRAHLAPYKIPARFFPIGAFPVTVSANATKIRKDVLRQMAQDLMNSS